MYCIYIYRSSYDVVLYIYIHRSRMYCIYIYIGLVMMYCIYTCSYSLSQCVSACTSAFKLRGCSED